MKKIIIVGGGIAGLVAGIYAQKAGFESEIYEKNNTTGGLCTGWVKKDHYIDNCVRWLTGTEKGTQLRRLWEEVGALTKNTEFVPNETFYSSEYHGETATLWKDLNKTEKELCELSPEDEENIHTFIEAVKSAQCRKMPVDKPMDLMAPPEMIKLGKSMSGMRKVKKEFGNISLKDYAKRFKSPLIQKLFTDFFTEESVATSLIFSYASISCGNGEIPVGGSVKMIERITKKYQELGGKIFLNHPVKKIKIEDNKGIGIELENGFYVEGDFIICSTDTYEAFYHLIGKEYISSKWDTIYNERSQHPVYSKFQMALSVDQEVCPTYSTLFFDCNKIKIATSVVDRICIHTYQTEPDFAQNGKTVLQIKIEQNEIDYNYWNFFSSSMYEQKKKEYADLVLEQLLLKYKELEGHFEVLDIWTPKTYHTMYHAFKGSFMRYREKPDVSDAADNGIIKQVPNLYIASQWLQAPGGLPTAAAAGKFAIQRILKKEGKNVMF